MSLVNFHYPHSGMVLCARLDSTRTVFFLFCFCFLRTVFMRVLRLLCYMDSLGSVDTSQKIARVLCPADNLNLVDED